jgi:cytochrome P450
VFSWLTIQSTQKLDRFHVLEKTLKESQRLHPPLPLIYRHTKTDCVISDYNVPKNVTFVTCAEPVACGRLYAFFLQTDIIIPTMVLQRDPLYWENPRMFQPERFGATSVDSITPYTYLPYGMGPRDCIGSSVADYTLKVFLIQFLQRYCAHITPV